MSVLSDPKTSVTDPTVAAAAALSAEAAVAASPSVVAPPIEDEPAAARRLTVIKTKSAWAVFDLRELWLYRDLLVALALRDIKLRYRQTALGPIWVVLQPLISAGVVTILFSRFAKMPTGDIPDFVFAFAGMTGWSLFVNTVNRTSVSLLANTQLVAKVYFPRIALPISTALSAIFDLAVSIAVLAALMAATHVMPSVGILMSVVWLFLIFIMAMGIGLFAGALMVSYRDVGQILPLILQYGMYATPAGYSLAAAIDKSPKFRWFFEVNPLSHLLEGLRWSIFGAGHGVAPPSSAGVAYAVIVAALVLFGGMLGFGHMQRKFADII